MRVFRGANVAFLVLLSFTCLFPVLNTIAISFSSNDAVMSNRVSVVPIGFTVRAYQVVLQEDRIWTGYRNTIFYVLCAIVTNHIIITMAAYPLSRKRLLFRGPVMFYFAFTTLFSGGLIPTYLVVRAAGFIDTVWALIIPGSVSVWHLVILRTYFQGLPSELEEAASIDGMGSLEIMLRIFVPLSVPVYATFTLFFAVGMWNAYFTPLIYLNSVAKFPLQLVLRDLIVAGANLQDAELLEREAEFVPLTHADSLKAAVIIVIIAPIICLYPFLQKYFVHGMTVGSLKG